MKILIILTQLVIFIAYARKNKTWKPQKVPILSSPPYENPNFIKDRLKNIINKPEMPPTWENRFQQQFSPSYVDSCDPYHCNDYHKTACGHNKEHNKYKWFQSTCHLLLNNQCNIYRGNLAYLPIATEFCSAYVYFLRSGCPQYTDCDEHKLNPICAYSSKDGHVVLFENKCFLDAANCMESTFQEYEEVKISICETALYYDYEPDPNTIDPKPNAIKRKPNAIKRKPNPIEPLMNKKIVANLGEEEIFI